MRIANNIMAMNTHRQYTINNNNVAKSAEKLSSGYRVNRAGDDAAGLAISEKMRAQIRGLNMAAKNSQDGNSLIQTAEGALQEVHSILQRMNELAVQSATGTNQTLDRNALNAEFQQLSQEIDDISAQTTFNDMNILDGTFTNGIEFTAGAPTTLALVGTGPVASVRPTEAHDTDGWVAAYANKTLTFTSPDSKTVTELTLRDVLSGDIDWNHATDNLADGKTILVDLTTLGLGSYELKNSTGGFVALDDIGADIEAMIDGKLATQAAGADQSLKVQVGAKEAEQMLVNVEKITSETLGFKGRAIDNQENASRAISLTRSAINQVSSQRASLGAAQNRLDHKIANLNNSVENLAAAESRIRDVDMASEMTKFTKANVLSQASTAMLAQANSLPQNVLSLLR